MTRSSAKILAGTRILIMRAARQAGTLARLLRERGAKVVSVPVIEIVPAQSFAPLNAAISNLVKFDWVILTSVNGVDALFRCMKSRSIPASALQAMQIAAIGPATRAAIEQRGLEVAAMPREYVAEAVVHSLKNKVRGKRVLLVRAAEARDVIPRELRRGGAKMTVVAAYETVMPADARKRLRSLFLQRPPDVITFTSSSSVRNFLQALPTRMHRELRNSRVALASIGPVTTQTLRQHGLHADIEARQYTMQGLTDAIARWAADRKTH
jgi:uroporphyrinogen-III synthase